jgi:hypothetical protein
MIKNSLNKAMKALERNHDEVPPVTIKDSPTYQKGSSQETSPLLQNTTERNNERYEDSRNDGAEQDADEQQASKSTLYLFLLTFGIIG